MANLNEAVEQVRSVARTFQAVIDLTDVLGNVASIEQAAGEAGVRLSAINVQIAEAESQRDAATGKAVEIVSAAESKASEIRTAATNHAEEVTAQANAIRNDALEAAATATESAKAALESLKVEADAVISNVETKTAELADLENKIAKAQAQISKILGG